MADKDKDKETSVIFSLRELKRIAPGSSADTEKKKEEKKKKARVTEWKQSLKADEPDEQESEALVTQALSSLKAQVDAEQRRLEEARQRAEEEKRLQGDLVRLDEEEETARQALLKAEHDRKVVEERVDELRRRLAPLMRQLSPEEQLAHLEQSRPPGVILKPPVLAVVILAILGIAGGLAAYIATRKPVVRVVTKTRVDKTVREPQLFGPEISWLNVADTRPDPSPGVRSNPRGSRGSSGESGKAPGGDSTSKEGKIVLPSGKCDGGFCY